MTAGSVAYPGLVAPQQDARGVLICCSVPAASAEPGYELKLDC